VRCLIDKLDALVSPELKTLFLHHSNKGVVDFIVDLSQVKYCDSSGLSALLVGNRIINEKIYTYKKLKGWAPKESSKIDIVRIIQKK
jgi:hypothetical protein